VIPTADYLTHLVLRVNTENGHTLSDVSLSIVFLCLHKCHHPSTLSCQIAKLTFVIGPRGTSPGKDFLSFHGFIFSFSPRESPQGGLSCPLIPTTNTSLSISTHYPIFPMRTNKTRFIIPMRKKTSLRASRSRVRPQLYLSFILPPT